MSPETSKLKANKSSAITRPLTTLNPIQASMTSIIDQSKKRAVLEGRNDTLVMLSAVEYAIRDPKGFKKFLRDLDSLTKW